MSKKLPKTQLSLENKNVTIANALTMSAQSLTLSEKRILFAAIAKGGGLKAKISLSAQEYAATYGLAQNQAYEQIKEAAKNIFNRYITLTHLDNGGDVTRHFRWVEAYEYKEGLGYVNLVFTTSVMPYLLALEVQFTKYKLRQACALRSVYSWRLLELFEQQSKGFLNISLENFHHAMNSKITHRKNFKDTRSKIIEPAVKELIQKDGWVIEWEVTNPGKKVTDLKFVFKK